MIGIDRDKREGPHLEWRVRLFVVAAVIGLAGIYFEDRRLTAAAIALLVAGVALRFVPRRVANEGEEDAEG